MLIDTHCHMNLMIKEKFDAPVSDNDLSKAKEIINEAKKENVNYIINAGTNLIESENCIKIAKNYKNIYAAIGIHPTDCKDNWKDELKKIQKLLENKNENKIVAIGEIGLDFYWPGYDAQRQKEAFIAQIELAIENNLPIIVHMRNAQEDVLQILQNFKNKVTGVFHCFSQDMEYAEKVIDIGFLIGIGGVVTYPKNTSLRDVVTKINLQNIILETDAPFLPPQIARGKQNHPKYIKHIAEYLAEIRNQKFVEIADQTTKNALLLFGIKK
jgi:TatD DNase family protein